jgi:hypothetical protein
MQKIQAIIAIIKYKLGIPLMISCCKKLTDAELLSGGGGLLGGGKLLSEGGGGLLGGGGGGLLGGGGGLLGGGGGLLSGVGELLLAGGEEREPGILIVCWGLPFKLLLV